MFHFALATWRLSRVSRILLFKWITTAATRLSVVSICRSVADQAHFFKRAGLLFNCNVRSIACKLCHTHLERLWLVHSRLKPGNTPSNCIVCCWLSSCGLPQPFSCAFPRCWRPFWPVILAAMTQHAFLSMGQTIHPQVSEEPATIMPFTVRFLMPPCSRVPPEHVCHRLRTELSPQPYRRSGIWSFLWRLHVSAHVFPCWETSDIVYPQKWMSSKCISTRV